MQEAHTRAAKFGFFPFVLGVFFIAPLVSEAGILYGPDAHKKDYTLTATPLPGISSDGWDRFGDGALGIFFSVSEDDGKDLLFPEVLILPCIKERPCVSLSLEEPSPITRAFSFLHTTDTLAVDHASAADLENMARFLCSLKEKNLPQEVLHRAFIDVVTEDRILHKEMTGAGCDLTYPKKHTASFLSRIFVRGVSNN